MRPQKLFLVIAVLSFVFLSAAECDDQCSKCQSAINHMFEKIEVQACNPNTMQKAWDGIREECDHSDSAVGLMAETCSLGGTARPGCNLPGAVMSDHSISIHLTYSTILTDKQYNISISIRDHLSVYETMPDEIETFIFSPDGFVINEGDEVEVIVEVLDANGAAQEIARASETFTFARNGSWNEQRGVDFFLREEDTLINFLQW